MLPEIGEKLRIARGQRGLTLQDVERETRIRARFLAALEASQPELLPSPVQVRGFLRSYAEFLRLDANQLLELLASSPATPQAAANISTAPVLSKVTRLPTPAKPDNADLPNKSEPVLSPAQAPARPEALDNVANAPVDPFQELAELIATTPALIPATAEPSAAWPKPAKQPQLAWRWRIRRWLSWDLAILIGLTAVLAGFVTWVLSNPDIRSLAVASPNLTPLVLGGTPQQRTSTPVPSPTVGRPTPTVENSTVQLELIITQSTYVQVQVDGKTEFAGQLNAKDRLSYGGAQHIEVSTSNAAGVQVVYNLNELGLLGKYGELQRVVFEPNNYGTSTPQPNTP
jgi:hypothetical protein